MNPVRIVETRGRYFVHDRACFARLGSSVLVGADGLAVIDAQRRVDVYDLLYRAGYSPVMLVSNPQANSIYHYFQSVGGAGSN